MCGLTYISEFYAVFLFFFSFKKQDLWKKSIGEKFRNLNWEEEEEEEEEEGNLY